MQDHDEPTRSHCDTDQDTLTQRPAVSPATAESAATVVPANSTVDGACPTCSAPAEQAGDSDVRLVYAIGRIEARFPTVGIEKELAQATKAIDTAGLTDRQALHKLLVQPQHRYLVRQLCWVLTIEGIETYLLQVRDTADLDLLVDALRPTPQPADLDVVIGVRGPMAPPQMCNGLMLPIVLLRQTYSFDRTSLIESIPQPAGADAEAFKAGAEELFDRLMQLADNAGTTDEHRAVNYLAVRYPAMYAKAVEAFVNDQALTAVDVRRSPLGGARKLVEVVFSFTHRQTDVTTKFFVRVDVTEPFPFLVTKMSPYYDR